MIDFSNDTKYEVRLYMFGRVSKSLSLISNSDLLRFSQIECSILYTMHMRGFQKVPALFLLETVKV